MTTLVAAATAAFTLNAATAQTVEIDYDEFELKNGLRVVVHEDRKAPLVAVSVWYHVGSKDEPEGKTGFAHLFEHLMFNGSENYDGEWFEPFEEIGATDLNGTTWFDRTNYFQTVPTPALDLALWMESDRMGHLLGAVTQEKLDSQRGVVQNEKRQGDNRPYGRSQYAVLTGLLPEGHPYSHSTIGSLEDLDAASLEDVKEWFKQYYGAANAVIVLAGDIDVATAKPLIEKYFGDIEAGPPLSKSKVNAPQLATNKSEVMYDQVPQPRIDRNWVAPGRTTKESIALTLAANILGGGKTSRLYQKLVYDLELATNATASQQGQELMSFYSVTIDAKKGANLHDVETAMEETITEFLAKGPSKIELARAKTSIKAGIIRGLEQVGGFGGKATLLAQGALYADDPGFYKKQLSWLDAATPKEVLAAARKVMNAGYYELTVLPFDDYETSQSDVDRTTGIPTVTNSPNLIFPEVKEDTLTNGIKVVLAERNAVPIVNVAIQFDAGYAADSVENGKLGTASFASSMLDEGTKKRSAQNISEELEGLGATLSTNSTLDTTRTTLSALKENLQLSLGLMADIIQNPVFDQNEIDKLRTRWLATIEQEKASPLQLALRLLPPYLYGDGHAYSVPLTGSGTAESILSLTRNDLVQFHKTWLQADNATIFVVGDVSMEEIKPLLEQSFGSWRDAGISTPQKNITDVTLPTTSKVIIVDKPGSPQSLILAGHLAPSTLAENNVAITAMNDILGGQFTARINMNLREDKGWAYGAYTFFRSARGQRPFMVYAPVQTDKTKESIVELLRELNDFKASRPATARELERATANNTRSLPGAFETSSDVLGSLASSARFGRPWNFPATLKDQFDALSLEDIKAATNDVIQPDSLTWVVIGDREKIEADIRALGLGEVTIMSADEL